MAGVAFGYNFQIPHREVSIEGDIGLCLTHFLIIEPIEYDMFALVFHDGFVVLFADGVVDEGAGFDALDRVDFQFV